MIRPFLLSLVVISIAACGGGQTPSARDGIDAEPERNRLDRERAHPISGPRGVNPFLGPFSEIPHTRPRSTQQERRLPAIQAHKRIPRRRVWWGNEPSGSTQAVLEQQSIDVTRCQGRSPGFNLPARCMAARCCGILASGVIFPTIILLLHNAFFLFARP